jgi:Ribonuclease G/E
MFLIRMDLSGLIMVGTIDVELRRNRRWLLCPRAIVSTRKATTIDLMDMVYSGEDTFSV